jgi:type I restriction enzyme S subunit
MATLGEVVKPSRPRVKPADHPHLPFLGMEHVEAHSTKILGSVPAAQMKSTAVRFDAGDVLCLS